MRKNTEQRIGGILCFNPTTMGVVQLLEGPAEAVCAGLGLCVLGAPCPSSPPSSERSQSPFGPRPTSLHLRYASSSRSSWWTRGTRTASSPQRSFSSPRMVRPPPISPRRNRTHPLPVPRVRWLPPVAPRGSRGASSRLARTYHPCLPPAPFLPLAATQLSRTFVPWRHRLQAISRASPP